MDQVLQIALESPLPQPLDAEVAQPIAPLTTASPEAPTAHQ
jgi:hypothetical protein